jgi:hypothetical protein
MRSKWLAWKPEKNSVGFEGPPPEVFSITPVPKTDSHATSSSTLNKATGKTTDPEPTKPTEPGFVGSTSGGFSNSGDQFGRAVRAKNARSDAVLSDTIPEDAIRLAPRYDGIGLPLGTVPACWCCGMFWVLDRLQKDSGRTIAWLKPDCNCLNVPQALACCNLCLEHCQCLKGQRVRSLAAGERIEETANPTPTKPTKPNKESTDVGQ